MSAKAPRDQSEPAIPLVPSHEEAMLREAVAGIAGGHGPAYMLRCADSGDRGVDARLARGKPIGTDQGLSHPLAQRKVDLELARLMTRKAYEAIQVHGGNGIALEYRLTDMWWGARLNEATPVGRETILSYVAEHSLGLPKSC